MKANMIQREMGLLSEYCVTYFKRVNGGRGGQGLLDGICAIAITCDCKNLISWF